jgi:hypothetical protein
MARWCAPKLHEPGDPPPGAWLASSPEVEGLDRALRSGRPVGVLVAGADEPNWYADRAGTSADRAPVRWPDGPGIDASACWPVTPFVRARWRARHGLPDSLVVDAGDLPDDVRPTALALAAAVVAQGELVVEALAWGAPCATDPASAAAAGATDGVEVVVGPPADLPGLAAGLAADRRRGAALGRAGRRLVERRHDTSRPAAEIARRLGLLRPGPADRLAEALDELWAPAAAPIRARAAAAGL